MKQLLRVDPAKRLTAAEALQHPWCTAALSEAMPELPRTLDNLRRISRSRFRVRHGLGVRQGAMGMGSAQHGACACLA